MQFICYQHWDQLPKSADKLFSTVEKKSIFQSRTWFTLLANNVLEKQQSLLLACVIDDAEVLAILPLVERTLTNLGTLSSQFTTLFAPLIVTDQRYDQILQCLSNGLIEQPFQSIRFEPVDKDSRDMLKLQEIFQTRGLQAHSHFKFYNWTHLVAGESFNQYFSKRPAILRNSILRKKRRLEREHETHIHLYKNNNLHKALTDYSTVYEASWKANETLSDFTPELVKALARRGWLRLAVLYIDMRPIAAQIWMVVHHKASIYRLVHDQSWHKYSPGSILTHHLMRHVIETDYVTEVDFLTGNEAYKQDWMTVRNERWSINFVKPANNSNKMRQYIHSLKERIFSKSLTVDKT